MTDLSFLMPKSVAAIEAGEVRGCSRRSVPVRTRTRSTPESWSSRRLCHRTGEGSRLAEVLPRWRERHPGLAVGGEGAAMSTVDEGQTSFRYSRRGFLKRAGAGAVAVSGGIGAAMAPRAVA